MLGFQSCVPCIYSLFARSLSINYLVISLSILSFRDNNCNFRSYVQSFKYLFAEYTFFADILK